jgi:hypothetical protein
MSFASRVERLKREFGRTGSEGLVVTVATDFLSGGAPSFARIFNRKGQEISAFGRAEDETLSTFRQRVRGEARSLAEAVRVVVGGLGSSSETPGAGGLPRGAVTLPDIPLHASQREARGHRARSPRCARVWQEVG